LSGGQGAAAFDTEQAGLRRATRRGLWNVAIEAYLTAAVMNLKRLAAFLRALLHRLTSLAAARYRGSPAARQNRDEPHASCHGDAIAA